MAGDALPKLPAPGDVIGGKYEIVQPIGKGGMGVVFEALHLRLKQRVAIKMLFPHVRDTRGAVERFEREARAAGQLRGPNVARVLDVETQGTALPFIVMEYLEGNDLDDELAGGGRMPVEQAVDYILQACTAMREAHFLGIVHRDLKPANLFLCKTADGPLIKVLDFGISKITSEVDGRLTGPLQTMGSPVYMSPEQLRGLRGVDARTDLWALGVTLFELVAGRPPFQGTVTATIASILSDPPTPPSALRHGVPPGFDDVVLKTLSKKAADRYPDAETFAEALVPYASPEGVRRLRASLATPPSAHAGRGSGTEGDRNAQTVAVKEVRPYSAGSETAQSWSTVSLAFGGVPRSRVVLMTLGGGAVVGVLAAIVMVAFSRRPPEVDSASLASPSAASSSLQAPLSDPAVSQPLGSEAASAQPWTVVTPPSNPGTPVGTPQGAGQAAAPTSQHPPDPGSVLPPAVSPSSLPPAHRPSWTGPRRPSPSPTPPKANPTHL